jgi:hypothetical protein
MSKNRVERMWSVSEAYLGPDRDVFNPWDQKKQVI